MPGCRPWTNPRLSATRASMSSSFSRWSGDKSPQTVSSSPIACWVALSNTFLPSTVRWRVRDRRSEGWGRRSTSPRASRLSTTATIELGGIRNHSLTAFWESPSDASMARINANWRGSSSISAIRAWKRRAVSNPSWDRRKPTACGGRPGNGERIAVLPSDGEAGASSRRSDEFGAGDASGTSSSSSTRFNFTTRTSCVRTIRVRIIPMGMEFI
jgi:hypothetical protein